MEEKRYIEVLPPEDPSFLERQSTLIPLNVYVELKQAEKTVANIRRLVFAKSDSNFIDKDDLMLLLGIVRG